MTLLCILVPVWAVALGGLCWCCPPQGPTWAFGYRSRRARASDASWLFAQDMAGKIWTCLGILMLAGTLLYLKPLQDASYEALFKRALILIVGQNICIFLSLLPVEFQLIRLFDRFGRRRGVTEPEPAAPPAQEFEPTAPLELPPQEAIDSIQPPADAPQYVPGGFVAAGEFAAPVDFPHHGEEDVDLPISDEDCFNDPVFSDPVKFSSHSVDDEALPISDSAFFGNAEFEDPVDFPLHPADDEALPISDSAFFEGPQFQEPQQKPYDPFRTPEDFESE